MHNGHLCAAMAAAEYLACRVRLVLAARPPHRPPPVAAIEHRWSMLETACMAQPALVTDDIEVRRPDESYTIDTLRSVRRQFPDEPVFWTIGVDAFLEIGTWHRWQEVFGLAHLLLLDRPGATLDAPARAVYERLRVHALPAAPGGGIVKIDAPMLDVSASQIRASIAVGSPVSHLLPEGVEAYITQHGLYTGNKATGHPIGGFCGRGNE